MGSTVRTLTALSPAEVDRLGEAADQPAPSKDDDMPKFPISDSLARGLRAAGMACLGVAACLIAVWWFLTPELHVMLIVTIVFTTTGVMCMFGGWIGGMACWLLARIEKILEAYEIERIRRGKVMVDALEQINAELASVRADAEIDRGRVVAILEENAATLRQLMAGHKKAVAERAEMRSDIADVKAEVCATQPQPSRRRKRRPQQQRKVADTGYLAEMAEAVNLGRELERRAKDQPPDII